MKKIKDLNKWRDIPCSWIGNLYIVKIAIFPINTTQSLSKFQLYFADYKIHMALQETSSRQNDLGKEQRWGTHTSQIQNRAIAIKLW